MAHWEPRRRHPRTARQLAGVLGLALLASSAAGQSLSVGAELSGSLAPKSDDSFNDAEYQRSLLRLLRLRLTTELRLGDHAAILAEIRSDNLDAPDVYALYLRVRPWRERALDLQVGQIPPVFGAFSRRPYAYDNPLIGTPLGYHYLTTVRDDAAPASATDLERWRGRGDWLTYPVGDARYDSGLPLFNALRWDTGIEISAATSHLKMAAALTQGTLSRPRVRNDNDGAQVAARVAWLPVLGLELGASAAHGPYAETALIEALPPGGAVDHLWQTSWGFDVEYSRGYWLLRGEALWSRWDVARIDEPLVERPLGAGSFLAECRYRLRPGLYAAARVEHLGFGTIVGSTGPITWDADVSRIEAGVGYAPWRRTLLKGVYQHNWRDGGPTRSRGAVAGQVVLWF